MRKVVLTYGVLAGAIISGLMLIGVLLWENNVLSFEGSEFAGYGSMVIALAMIFLGIKSYRDNHQRGTISFGKGLQVGALITLIAGLMYAAAWEAYYQSNVEVRTTFMEKYTDHYLGKMKAEGASAPEIDRKAQEMARMAEMYKNPLIRFGFTLLEIVPVGIALTLLSAAVLRKKTATV